MRQTDYTGCTENAEVVYDAIAGAGHVWPGGPQDPPPTLDANATVWSFFAAHPHPQDSRQPPPQAPAPQPIDNR